MKTINSIIRVLVFPALVLCSLNACDSQSGPGPEIHDTKYVAIDAEGEPLARPAGDDDCVLDQFIGLVWEVKSNQPGLRDWRNTYSWYDPQESHDSELDYRGMADGGQCVASVCDTFAYVAAVNQSNYCGHSDWRLPTRDELGSISDPRKPDNPPTINMKYFPHTQAGEYWSKNDYQFQYDTAWLWNFKQGQDRVEWKKSPRYVRLVRGQAKMLQRVKE